MTHAAKCIAAEESRGGLDAETGGTQSPFLSTSHDASNVLQQAFASARCPVPADSLQLERQSISDVPYWRALYDLRLPMTTIQFNLINSVQWIRFR
jgi:hypothetical protein